MNDASNWKIEKIIELYGIFHLICPENWTTSRKHCPECNTSIPKYLIVQRDLLNGK